MTRLIWWLQWVIPVIVLEAGLVLTTELVAGMVTRLV